MSVDLHGPWIWDRSSGQIRTLPAEGRPHGAVVASVGNHPGFIEKGTIGPLLEAAPELLEAAQALGAMPEGYCFCSKDRIGDDSKKHEPECADLRAAIAKATGAA